MITPSLGDKLQANPSYICYDTYTYVITSKGRVMGCHTYSVYLRTIAMTEMKLLFNGIHLADMEIPQ